MRARKRVVQGSTSAGKTYAIIPVLIDRALKTPRIKITVVAETLPAVKEGAMDIFQNVMYDTNRWIENNWNASSLTYTYGNKSRIQFKSFDSVGKAKSSGKRDILFINEGNHIAFEIADALMIRSKETYIDFNPDHEFWVHTEVLPEPNSEFLILTFEDNEALPPETLEDLMLKKAKAFHNPNLKDEYLLDKSNIKNAYWFNWWQVYGMGLVGVLQGVVFENWKQIDGIPVDAKLIGRGLDFGFTNDPTALIDVYETKTAYYLDERIYQTRLTNTELIALFKALRITNEVYTYADQADPKSIKELKDAGFKVVACVKGADSVAFGIQKLQGKDIFVTRRSKHLIEEFQKYKWAEDSAGNPTNRPIDAWNHGIDAVRYAVTSQKKKPKQVKALLC